jgi:hypothetical protein
LALSEMEAHLQVLAAKLRFVPSKADLDLWIRKAIDGSYKHIAYYMDEIIVIPKDAMKLIDMFKETLCSGRHRNTEVYLGGNFHQITDPELNKNKDVQVTIMVDADHAHCDVTRRSVTGVFVFINSTVVGWYSKCKRRLRHLFLWIGIGCCMD